MCFLSVLSSQIEGQRMRKDSTDVRLQNLFIFPMIVKSSNPWCFVLSSQNLVAPSHPLGFLAF